MHSSFTSGVGWSVREVGKWQRRSLLKRRGGANRTTIDRSVYKTAPPLVAYLPVIRCENTPRCSGLWRLIWIAEFVFHMEQIYRIVFLCHAENKLACQNAASDPFLLHSLSFSSPC